MDKLISFLNNENEHEIILDTYDNSLISLLADYCGFNYDILGNNNIRIIQHNNNTNFSIHNEPVIGGIYIGDGVYLLKTDNNIDNSALHIFMSNFKSKISDDIYHFITMLNSIGSLKILSDNKHAIKAINKYPNIKVKKVCNFYIIYVPIENKVLVVSLINMMFEAYYIVNMFAYGDTSSLKLSKKFKPNKCINTCKNITNPFCNNDHGKNNYLYCKNQIKFLQTNGFCEFIINKYRCPDPCCQGYHIFRLSSPNNYEIKKSI